MMEIEMEFMFCVLLTVLKFLKLREVHDLVQFLVVCSSFITHMLTALSKGKASKSFSCFKKKMHFVTLC